MLAALLLLLSLFVGGARGAGASPESAVSLAFAGRSLSALHLENQARRPGPHWTFYDAGDAPQGAFMGWMPPGSDSLQASIPLGRTLPAGRYFVGLKGLSYGASPTITASLGGAEASLQVSAARREFGFWTPMAALDAPAPADSLRLTLRKTKARTEEQKYLLTGLYLTSDSAEVVVSDQVVRLRPPQPNELSTAPPRQGNLVENSSFEVGVGHGWALSENDVRPLVSLWDAKTGRFGRAGLRLGLNPSAVWYGNAVKLISKPIRVQPNARYTLSAYVRRDRGSRPPVRGWLRLGNIFAPPAGLGTRHQLVKAFTATARWRRIKVSGYVFDYPTSDYQIEIAATTAAGRQLWIDGVQLEQGSAARRYTPASELELGLRSEKPGNVFFDDERISMKLVAANSGDRRTEQRVRYEVRDYRNRKVKEGSLAVAVAPRAVGVETIAVGARSPGGGSLRGSFRILVWVEAREGTEEEVAFAVVPRPQRRGRDPSSVIGIHSPFRPDSAAVLARLGIKWDRVLSPSAFFRWGDPRVEPREGQITWFDKRIDAANGAGISVLGTIGMNDIWPPWANLLCQPNGTGCRSDPSFSCRAKAACFPDLGKWREFVSRLVRHYKGRVAAWEIWNEPNYIWTYDPNPAKDRSGYYAQMLKSAAEVIRQEDPAALVVGMGGSYRTDFMLGVIGALERLKPAWSWTGSVDALSTHLYPEDENEDLSSSGRAAAFREAIVDRYNKPVWNTESGSKDNLFYMGPSSRFVRSGRSVFGATEALRYYDTSVYSVESIANSLIDSLGNGISKYFYYDARLPSPETLRDEFTLWQLDGTLKPKGVAYAVLARLLDHAVGLGRIAVRDAATVAGKRVFPTTAYLFERRERQARVPLVALSSGDNRNRALTLSLPPSRYRVYDVMGNIVRVRGGVVSYGRLPVIIEGTGIDTGGLRRAFESATIRLRTDKSAPGLALVEAPVGPVPGTRVRIRYVAIDETSVPTLADLDAILYSSSLARSGRSGQWSRWSPETVVEYTNLPAGSYSFKVKARDAAGNQTIARHTIVIAKA